MKKGEQITFIKGKSYRIHMPQFGETRKVHIVELIENDMVVYKFFGKRKQWWHYDIDHISELQFRYEQAQKTKSPL